MKLIFAFTTLVFAITGDNPIAYICDQCDLHDTSTNTMFDNLEIPFGPRPPPSSDSTMSIHIKHNEQLQLETQSVLKYLLTITTTSVLICLINLLISATRFLTKRNVSASAARTYMKTAIIETE